MYQFRFLGMPSAESHGFVWFLDDEWNHFTFNGLYLSGLIVVFTMVFRAMKKAGVKKDWAHTGFMYAFLWMEGWHMVEHTYRIVHHAQGLCDQCAGILDPLTGINRLTLHFWFNFLALILPAVVYMWFAVPALLAPRVKAFLPRLRPSRKAMLHVLLVIAGVAGAGIIAACAVTGNSAPAMTVLVRNSGYQATLLMPETLLSGQTYPVSFLIAKNGRPADIMQDNRMLHAVVASAEYGDIEHTLSLRNSGDGVYTFPHAFTQAGEYGVWLEISDTGSNIHHGDDANLIAFQNLTVSPDPSAPPLSPANAGTTDDLAIVLAPQDLKAGVPATLELSVRGRDGTPVRLLAGDNIMFALVGDGFTFFRHGHFGSVAADGLSARLETVFPGPGIYGLWLETYVFHNGDMRHIVKPLAVTVL